MLVLLSKRLIYQTPEALIRTISETTIDACSKLGRPTQISFTRQQQRSWARIALSRDILEIRVYPQKPRGRSIWRVDEEEYEDTTAPPPSKQKTPETTSNLPTSTSSLLYGAPAFEKEEAESENPLFEGVAGTRPQVQAVEQFQDVAMNKLANYDYFHVRMCSHVFTSIESIYTVPRYMVDLPK